MNKLTDNVKVVTVIEELAQLQALRDECQTHAKWLRHQQHLHPENEFLTRAVQDAELAGQFAFGTMIELNYYIQGEN